MRCILAASLLAASLASNAIATHSHSHAGVANGKRRKTLGFGPVHPHKVFDTTPMQPSSFAPLSEESDPLEVAMLFINKLVAGQDGADFEIRKDSYTDSVTGITHVYAQQYKHSLEVADGVMNLNIKDGVVLSYGNSFYNGNDDSSRFMRDPHAEYCHEMTSQLREQSLYAQDTEQTLLGGASTLKHSAHDNILGDNCVGQSFDGHHEYDSSPVAALLHFMIQAAPEESHASSWAANAKKHIGDMSAFDLSSFVGEEDGSFHIPSVPGTVNPVKAKMVFTQVPNASGSVDLVRAWRFEIEMEDNWYEASVSVEAPFRVISVADWASDSPIPLPDVEVSSKKASYNVFAWGINDPSEGKRSTEKENFDDLAAPVGWHSLPYENDPVFTGKAPKGEKWHNTTTTYGNNVFAHEDWEGQNNWLDNYRPTAAKGQAFDYEYNPKDTDKSEALAEAKKYINATVTQLFYTTNMFHDLTYRYGFDEEAGNFQQHNFGRGGKENDAVIANAQDGSGFNNANFMTPPDGQNGRCRMYLWNTASPYRDGDLEAGIVIHELAHGLSTRLTGGPSRSGCLGWGESGGMGEGWGDFLATTIRSTSEYSDYAMGAWAANRESGIRNYVYSLNDTINPSTYKTLDKPGYWGVHAIGEVWAEILWVVSQKLIDEHGFSDTLYPPKPLENGTVPEGDFYRARSYTASGKAKPLVPKHGNSLIVQLVITGMKLQPCNPSFFDARDAILQADDVLTGGENYCTLWKGFAERGLGPKARVDGRTPWGGGIRTNDFDAPSKCVEKKPKY